MELTASTIIDGKYQVVRQLGEGGMGAVYEARHRGTGRRVAVKVIAGAMLARNPEVISRFQREAMASGAIESQYIAQILDTGIDPTTGSPYTVMELLVGEDLQQAMQRLGPLPPELAMRIVAQAGMGLRKAHESSVVHRDIKPANLFLSRREEGDLVVKLLDFGIAKVRADQGPVTGSVAESGGLTRTGAMLGSPLYMSPEQARGKRDIDHRTDVWSLGVVLYEALAGTTPHGHIESIGELILQICSTPPRPVQELAPWVPPEVASVVHRALALDPAQRFQSAAEMVDALRALLPGGTALSESMFVPMTEQARAAAAPKMALTSGMRAPSPSLVSSTTIGVSNSGAAAATNVAARPKSRAPVLVGVALVMAGVGVAAAWKVASSRRAPAAEASAASTIGVASPPPPASAPAVPSTAVALAPLERTVQLVVLPAAASAQVDGASVPVQDGAVAVTGALGSVHHVRLTSGRADQTFEVAIADEGPVPPKIELPVPKPAGGGGPAPTHPPPAQPATTSTSSMHMDLK